MATVVPHLHVRHLTSSTAPNNVSRWKCEYDVADPYGTFSDAYGTFTAMTTVSVTNPADTTFCGLVDLGDLDLGAYGASAIVHCKISRLANSDCADTDTSVIALYSADLHYQTRTAGGRARLLPSTGFAPGRVSILPSQPDELAYAATELVLEIPSLWIKSVLWVYR